MLADISCPSCNAVLPEHEVADGWCESCGKKIPAYILHSETGELSSRRPTAVAPRRLSATADRHTVRCDKLLPEDYRGRFPVLAQVMEKASILWAFLSPLVWSLMNKHYVIGYDAASRSLYLFRLSMGFFGAGAATEVHQYPIGELREFEYRKGILTARVNLQTRDGKRIKLFVPMPAQSNARSIYDAATA
jgi:hypothetical protein